MDEVLSQIEEQFLVLLFENGGIYPQYERWDLGPQALQQGKIIFWYSGQLNAGSKTLLKIMRRFGEKDLLIRKDTARDRSPVMKYILTKKGMELALEIRSKNHTECSKSPEECIIKVLTTVSSSKSTEQPLFAIKNNNILSIENVTIKKESEDRKKSVITRGDTLIVTVRINNKIPDAREIFIKGIECDIDSFKKAQRYALIFLQQRGDYNGNRLTYKFIPLEPLPDDYLSRKTTSRQKTKKLLKEWQGHDLNGS
ncbi:MAG: hypothetical protein ACW963_00700 [Candidatus Sifarchaeia archaeon]|jgi:hypothetical protein